MKSSFREKISRFITTARARQVFWLMAFTWIINTTLMSRGATHFSNENMVSAELTPKFWLAISSVAISNIIYLGWIWLLGDILNKRVGKSIRMQRVVFFWGIFFLFVGWSGVEVYRVIFGAASNPPVGLLIPLGGLAIFCSLYVIYFIAKNLVMAEKDENVTFGQYFETLLFVYFFPVGIWFIQPRVNRLFLESKLPKQGPAIKNLEH